MSSITKLKLTANDLDLIITSIEGRLEKLNRLEVENRGYLQDQFYSDKNRLKQIHSDLLSYLGFLEEKPEGTFESQLIPEATK